MMHSIFVSVIYPHLQITTVIVNITATVTVTVSITVPQFDIVYRGRFSTSLFIQACFRFVFISCDAHGNIPLVANNSSS